MLGDLDLPEFEYANEDPMDLASPRYCQAVARKLSELTGVRWSAPVTAKHTPGYYVLPEYDLDPIDFPHGVVAGVELLTPPLPLAGAEAIRGAIVASIDELGGEANFFPNRASERAGWHINIDAGEYQLDPFRFIFASDELKLLSGQERLNNGSAAPQRHAYGVPLLRYSRDGRHGSILAGTGMINLLSAYAGRGKRYAANFDKLDRGYVELRHFSAATFFADEALHSLVSRSLGAFEISNELAQLEEERLKRRFLVLAEWLEDHDSLIEQNLEPSFSMSRGEILFGGQIAARVAVNGTADLTLLGRAKHAEPLAIRDVLYVDLKEALALLALDVAELRGRKIVKLTLRSERFSKAIDRLIARLQSDNLLLPSDLDRGVWWTDR
ncbi:MAG: hypothetical protein ACRCS5_05970 [Sphingomonas sp.]